MKNNNLFKKYINIYGYDLITFILTYLTAFATWFVRGTFFLAHRCAFVPCPVRGTALFTHGTTCFTLPVRKRLMLTHGRAPRHLESVIRVIHSVTSVT